MNPEWHSAVGKGSLRFRHSPQQASVLAGGVMARQSRAVEMSVAEPARTACCLTGAVAALAGGRGMRHECAGSDLDGLPEVYGSYF